MNIKTPVQFIKQDNITSLSQTIEHISPNYLYLIRSALAFESSCCLEFLLDHFDDRFKYLYDKGLPWDIVKQIKAYSFRLIELNFISLTLLSVLGKLFKVSSIYPETLAIKTVDDDPYDNISVLYYAIIMNDMNLFNLLIGNGFKMNMKYVWCDKGTLMKIYPYEFCSRYGHYHWLDIISFLR